MKKKRLCGVGLVVGALSLMVSCGGDDGGNDNTGGKGSNAGTSSGGSAAGTPSGGNSGNAGTSNNAGTDNGGSSNGGSGNGGSSNGGSSNGGSSNGGSNNNQGGDDDPGPGPQGGDGPGPQGGDGPGPQGGDGPGDPGSCSAGVECDQQDPPCETANGDMCFCVGFGQDDPEWVCNDFGDGQGGAGPGDFMADCGDNPMADDECEGFGQCEGSDTCACFGGNVTCGGGNM